MTQTEEAFTFAQEEEDDVTEKPDLEGFTPSAADLKLKTVFGDYLHDNDGHHLTGGIPNNSMWLDLWRKVAELPSQHYSLPKGKLGRDFLEEFTGLVEGIMERKCNG